MKIPFRIENHFSKDKGYDRLTKTVYHNDRLIGAFVFWQQHTNIGKALRIA